MSKLRAVEGHLQKGQLVSEGSPTISIPQLPNSRQTPESDWLFAPHKCEGQSYVTLGSASVDTNVFLARVAPHTCEGQSYVTLVLTSADPKVHPVGHALGSASVGTKVT